MSILIREKRHRVDTQYLRSMPSIRPIVVIVLLIAGIFAVTAPNTRAQFVHALGAGGFDEGIDVALDANGNSTFVGVFRGSPDFDPGAGSAVLTSVANDVYVASYDSAGIMRFAFQIGNPFATSEEVGGIGVDSGGGFAITGRQPFGTIDYDPDPDSTESRTGRLFVASYDSLGSFRFAVTPGGTAATSSGGGSAVVFDDVGNIYATGYFDGTLGFKPGTTDSLSSSGASDVFIAGYDATGENLFAVAFGGAQHDQGLDIAIDSENNLYVSGLFSGTVAFDPNDSDSNGNFAERTSAGDADVFIASYTSSGIFRFVRAIGGTATDLGLTIDVDAENNLYVAGSFRESVEFDPDDSNNDGDLAVRVAEGNGSAFLASFNASNEYRFAVSLEGGSTEVRGISTLGSGTSFVTGSFSGLTDFDPGPGIASHDSGSGTDTFVATYGSNGLFRGVFAVGGTGLNVAKGIDVDMAGGSVLTGMFSGTTDFDPGAGVDQRTGAGQTDLFMARYPPFGKPVGVSRIPPVAASPIVRFAPNPFADRAAIHLVVQRAEHVSVSVYDLLGRRVAELFSGWVEAQQERRISFDAAALPAGQYLILVEGETFRKSELAVRLR